MLITLLGKFWNTTAMAEKYPENIDIEDEEAVAGPVNKKQAEDYAHTQDKIISDFHQLLNEDRKDTLLLTIWSLMRHTSGMFREMKMADVDTIISCIKAPNCTYL